MPVADDLGHAIGCITTSLSSSVRKSIHPWCRSNELLIVATATFRGDRGARRSLDVGPRLLLTLPLLLRQRRQSWAESSAPSSPPAEVGQDSLRGDARMGGALGVHTLGPTHTLSDPHLIHT